MKYTPIFSAMTTLEQRRLEDYQLESINIPHKNIEVHTGEKHKHCLFQTYDIFLTKKFY